jgi:hypothetical protein
MDEEKGKLDGMNKTAVYVITAIVVLAVVAWGIYAYTHRSNNTANNGQQTTGQSNSNTAVAPAATTTPGSSAGKLSYGDAIKAYPERFQFTKCQGTPATIAIRKGSPVMLDNRNSTAYTFKADTQTFRIAGYDYAVLYPEVLGNLVVTCNGKDSVTLNVEK